MSYADEIKKMTSDPGARRLGAIADDLAAKLDSQEKRITELERKVAICCDAGSPVRNNPTPS